MLDFIDIRPKAGRSRNTIEVGPAFVVRRYSDLLIRGSAFYGIWDEESGLWSTNEFDVQRLVDKEVFAEADKISKNMDGNVVIKTMQDFSSGVWTEYKKYLKEMPDSKHTLDNKIVFQNTPVKKEDYISKRLPYSMEEGPIDAYEELMSTLYDPAERAKIEWAIGSIISGDSKSIQKFIVFYGEAGSGKSTVINIIGKLFSGYCTTFDAKDLASTNNTFATEAFRTNPLVAFQHDGDLSKIADNTKLNSIVSHEMMPMHEKYKATYDARCNAFLFMGTNKPVKITDAKSGLIRRLIDVRPSKRLLSPERYAQVVDQINFELGAIAYHCYEVYKKMGKNYYYSYRPIDMMYQTDTFFNFVESESEQLGCEAGISLKRAYDIYKEYCKEALINYPLQRHVFREELKSYFKEFYDRTYVDGKQVWSYYIGLDLDRFENKKRTETSIVSSWIDLKEQESIFDKECSECLAQYATENETPMFKWSNCKTHLSDIDSHKIHYVKIPENHIVIDFDLKDDGGKKSMKLNLEAASKWPKTYSEVSKGGGGLHLHYIYDGDPTKLAAIYSKDIEVKVYTGGGSLRRRLSLCNNLEIAHISSGLPLKEEKKKVVNLNRIKSEKSLRKMVYRILDKEFHGYTKPSMDFLQKVLDEAYESKMHYDISDMYQDIFCFASGSTHNQKYCLDVLDKLPLMSADVVIPDDKDAPKVDNDAPIVIFDIEVTPKGWLVCWKFYNDGYGKVFAKRDPDPEWLEEFFKFRLIGFNNRGYDNHILYAGYLGWSPEKIFELSWRIIHNEPGSKFGEAYNLSYTDIYDFSSKKQSLKKFEIELGIHHQELGMKWDEVVPEEKWPIVIDYCKNDVLATEAVFDARVADWDARLILSEITGMTPNDTTNSLTTRFIFEGNREPQSQFKWYDLGSPPWNVEPDPLPDDLDVDKEYTIFQDGKAIFPGYKFEKNAKGIYESTYRSEIVGEGGYVYSEPGIHFGVKTFDVASMHPHSIIVLNLFGDHYTTNFETLVNIRIAIKHKDYDYVRSLYDGKLAKYLTDDKTAKALSNALKIAINSVYGLTSAKFKNPFKDERNKDNIVAKRGALFMINLKHEVQRRGFTVAHIKTDSIKIPNPTPELEDFVIRYGKLYGYTFEIESEYERMCLVNDAVYIARYKNPEEHEHNGWTATGAEFAQPYVFKTLFSHEDLEFDDFCETKSCTTALYLDMNEQLEEGMHDYVFVGKVGRFSPIVPGGGGGELMREKDDKYYSVSGTKDYRWLESEYIVSENLESRIDRSYYEHMAKEAIDHISKFGDFESFAK